jgi:raffinose/stachyose/melibiose transport system substrate-binding protein
MGQRTRLSLVAAFGVAALLTVGLAGAAARSTPGKDVVTLRLLSASSNQKQTDVLIANFQRVYPNIQITAQYLTTTQAELVLLTQLQAGNGPDIFRIQGAQAPTGIWPLAEAGRLLDLSGRKWQKRMYPPAKLQYMYKGKVYGWPLSVNPYAVLYNTDLFKQLKLTVPTRFSDVLTMCRKITAAGLVPFVQAWGNLVAPHEYGPQRMAQYVFSVDPKWNDKRYRGEVKFSTSPLWRRALQSIVDMKDAGCFQPSPQGMLSRDLQYASFARGEAVMTLIAASELTSFLNVNPNLHYAMMNLPADDPKSSVVIADAPIGLSVNAATKYPEQAKTFIDFMAREQESSLYTKVSGEIAPLDVKKGKLPSYMLKDLGPFFKAGKVLTAGQKPWPNARIFEEGLSQGMIGLFTGQTTVDSILKKMDDLWDNG